MFSSNALLAFTTGHNNFSKVGRHNEFKPVIPKPACESPMGTSVLFCVLVSQLYLWIPRFGRSRLGTQDSVFTEVSQVNDRLSEIRTIILDTRLALFEKAMT